MIRRAWVWAFGPGRFGGALLWTLFVLTCLLAVPYALGWALFFMSRMSRP